MNVIARPRAGGKTRQIIDWAAEHDGVILVATKAESRLIAAQAQELWPAPRDYWARHVVHLGEVRDLRDHRRIAIDNVDHVLMDRLGFRYPPAIISITGEAL